jgi:hypothetical protein
MSARTRRRALPASRGLVFCLCCRGSICFTQVGAQKACELARKHGWSDRRAELTANAITLHLNVLVADRHGKEAKMVRAGSGADAAGLGLHVLQRDQIDEVVSRIPRLSLKKELLATLAD